MKKAQTANPQQYIALLIFVIGVSLVIYILMLPPADRADLLEQNRTRLGDGVKDYITVIMTKEPGTLSSLASDEVIQDFPPFNLYTRTDSRSLIEFDSIYIKKSLFEEQDRNISFTISEFESTDNIVLSFSTQKSSGILTILLNGKILSSEQITTPSPPPKRLPRDWLQPTNTLVFKVSGPGIEFWKSNEYLINNLKITADYTDKSGQENKQILLLTEQEKANLESFHLSFIADCRASEVGQLQIYLNKRLIYSSVPDCGFKVQVPPVEGSRLREGENDILFTTERGNFIIYAVEGKLKLKKPVYPTYYFYLDSEKFAKIKDGRADLNVTLLFPNSVDRKKGVLFVNDYFVEIETFDNLLTRIVNSFVREGNNAVEVRPRTEKIDILELKVVMAE